MDLASVIQYILMTYQVEVLKNVYALVQKKHAFKEIETTIEGKRFIIRYNDEIYLVLDERGVVTLNNIDNHDFQATLTQDKNDFGLVMVALSHISDIDFIKDLLDVYPQKFIQQLTYVLGFFTIEGEDGEIINLNTWIQQFLPPQIIN